MKTAQFKVACNNSCDKCADVEKVTQPDALSRVICHYADLVVSDAKRHVVRNVNATVGFLLYDEGQEIDAQVLARLDCRKGRSRRE